MWCFPLPVSMQLFLPAICRAEYQRNYVPRGFRFFHRGGWASLLYRFMVDRLHLHGRHRVSDELHGSTIGAAATCSGFHVVGECRRKFRKLRDYTAMQFLPPIQQHATIIWQHHFSGKMHRWSPFLRHATVKSVCLIRDEKISRSNNHIFYLVARSTEL